MNGMAKERRGSVLVRLLFVALFALVFVKLIPSQDRR